jgi:predicted nucleotidyltransferase
MRKVDVANLIGKLNEGGVRYLVVGGLAAVTYGCRRFTDDVDLVVGLERENLLRAMKILKGLGYGPRVPVAAEDFADPELREKWIREKGMVVFSMISGGSPHTNVDLFVTEPFDFDAEYVGAGRHEVEPGIEAPLVSIDQLIAMKQTAGRGKDLLDVEELKKIKELRDGGH